MALALEGFDHIQMCSNTGIYAAPGLSHYSTVSGKDRVAILRKQRGWWNHLSTRAHMNEAA
jgi:hypothetical protein